MKIKKGDKVIVLTGKDRGKTGSVLRVFPRTNKVIVEGINVAKKHRKSGAGREAGIVEIAIPLHVSNISLVDPKTNKATRVGYKVDNGKKVRVAKKSGATLN